MLFYINGHMLDFDINMVRGVHHDSRAIERGFVYVAIKGEKFNGEDFIEDAIASGATHVILSKQAKVLEKPNIRYYYVDNPKQTLAMLASEYYQPKPENVVAVTGTNGKTSTSNFFMQICHDAGMKSATIGTLGTILADRELYNYNISMTQGLTSPDSVTLNKILQDIASKGYNYVSLEASSHGLAQYRLDGLRIIKSAGFTNISHDHLDYHGTYENYFNAKLRLFQELLDERGVAVLNNDIAEYDTLLMVCKKRSLTVLNYGKNGQHIKFLNLVGDALHIELFGTAITVKFQLGAEFQVYNALCAFGMALAVGITESSALAALEKLKAARGRIEKVISLANGAQVYIDYAHTPDALERVLEALRTICIGRLHLVFGCGGDRDKGKRSIMGKVAARLANHIIVTDDNPRTENPASIRKDILDSCQEALEIGDRKEAILTAMQQLHTNDILLIAGKGHENYQIIGNKRIYFSDYDVVLEQVKSEIC